MYKLNLAQLLRLLVTFHTLAVFTPETDIPSSKSKLTEKQMDKIRRIFHPK